jgi:hypothetical protein
MLKTPVVPQPCSSSPIRVDEQGLREEGVVRAVGDDANTDPVRRVGARKRVDDVEVAAREVGRHLLAEPVEVVFREGVVPAPPDALFRVRFAHEVLVLGRAAGEAARVEDDRAALCELASSATQCIGVEARRGGVAVDDACGIQPMDAEIDVVRLVLDGSYCRSLLSNRAIVVVGLVQQTGEAVVGLDGVETAGETVGDPDAPAAFDVEVVQLRAVE